MLGKVNIHCKINPNKDNTQGVESPVLRVMFMDAFEEVEGEGEEVSTCPT